ncbi:TPA: hypothetical protein RG719_001326 [Morganella morganii subsp. morganii]|nr:hypothetical protein [Morganella morganii subsp. morganii]
MINLKNRKVFFLPVNTGYNNNGHPNCELIDFYGKRSSDRIYCSIVGNVVTPSGFGSNKHCVFLSKNLLWKKLAQVINDNGSIPGIQISSSWKGYSGITNFVASAESDFSHYNTVVKNINESDIDNIFRDFYFAVDLAIDAGFKHIQIHAAHGYIMSLLIDSQFCDRYLYAINSLKKLINYINSKNIETSLRFSLKIGVQYIDKKRGDTIEKIMSINSTYHDISFGFYNINKNMIYPKTTSMLISRFKFSLDLINKFNGNEFIISGKSLRDISVFLPENVSVGICRDLIANPNYLDDLNNFCNDCGSCHYHSLGQKKLYCTKWDC